MKNLFIPYNEAMALKKLGFDELCLGYYHDENKFFFTMPSMDKKFIPFYNINSKCGQYLSFIFAKKSTKAKVCMAPTYVQAFDFFKEQFKLTSHVDLLSINHLGEEFYYNIVNFADFIDESTTMKIHGFKTKEEAELACLQKLIQFLN